MTYVFFAMVAIAFAVAGVREFAWTAPPDQPDAQSPMGALAEGVIASAESSVTLALGLVGVMALFLGLMKVAEEGGLLVIIAKLVRPLMQRLFPDVPAQHPAMGAMILNMSANVLGLGNAATPFGIRAMEQLDKLNPQKGTASDSMVLFLAINTSSVTLLPTGVIALRAAAGSADPAGIVPTTLFATLCSTTIAILSAKLLQRFWRAAEVTDLTAKESAADPTGADPTGMAAPAEATAGDVPPMADPGAYPTWVSALVLTGILALIPLTVVWGRAIAPWIIPGLMVVLLGFGLARGVAIYDAFVEGGKEGFNVALRIIPYLVAILVAVGMFRASGAMEMVISPLSAITGPLGLPAEALPMALLRPLSGSGAYGILASILNDSMVGPDSYTGYLVSTLQGSTETTFYVLAVYFGAVGIRRIRHALAAGLLADVAGIAGAVIGVGLFLG